MVAFFMAGKRFWVKIVMGLPVVYYRKEIVNLRE